MTYILQARSEELAQISDLFRKHVQTIDQMRQELVRMNNRLKQCWVGLGSDAYFAQQDRLVLPAVQRLAEALGEANTLIERIAAAFGNADRQASSSFHASNGGIPGEMGRTSGGQHAGSGVGSADAVNGQHLADRLQQAGFGSGAADLRSAIGRPGTTNGDLMVPKDWLDGVGPDRLGTTNDPSAGSGDGTADHTGAGGSPTAGGSGAGSGGGGGPSSGAEGLGSLFGALRGQVGTGFGLSGTVSGGAPDVTYRGLGGFGGADAPRPPDFGLPIAIVAISPFAALLGKVVKDRTKS